MISRRNNGSARGRPRSPPRGAPHPQPQRKAAWVLLPLPAPIPALFPPGGLTCSISRLNWASRGLGSGRVGAPGTLRPTLLGAAGSLLPGLSLWGASWGGRARGAAGHPPCCLGASRRGRAHGIRHPGSPRGGQKGAERARETPSPSKRGGRGGGGEAQHGPRADEMLCQGSSSAGGHGEGQPAQGAGPPPNAALGPAARSPGGARPLPGAASQHGAPKCPPLPSLRLAGGRGPAGGSAHPYPQGATSWVPGCRAGASVRLSKHSGMHCPADDMRVSLCLTTRTREIFFFFLFFPAFFFF